MRSACEIYFYEAFEEEAEALDRHLPDGVRAGFTTDTIQEAGHAAPPCGLISIRTQSVVPVAWRSRLAGILSRSTGYDHLAAYRAATGGDLECGYLPLYCARAVAEQALLLWLALLRRLPLQQCQFRRFHRDSLTGNECRGKTLLVVGVGNIGSEVVDIGRGLGMNVLGVDPVRKCDGLKYVTLAEGMGQAHVVVSAMNLTEENRGLFNAGTLRYAKRAPIFVNVARGELVVAEDLLELLNKGILRGVGMDVYHDEPELAVALRSGRAGDNPAVRAVLSMAARNDVICTPHNAFNTEESVERKAAQSVEQFLHFRNRGTFLWSVP